jgi:tetratricopeptide (TPR) repeat protein
MSGARILLLIPMLLALAGQPRALAHGDLQLRIYALTREIAAATTNRAQLLLERGELQRDHGGFAEAAADFDLAAQIDPELVAVDFCRARLFAEQGKHAEAKALFDKGLEREPQDGEALLGRSRALLKLGETNAALADFRSGLGFIQDPNPDYYLELAEMLTAADRTNEAISAIDQGTARVGPLVRLNAYALELEISDKKIPAALERLEKIMQQAMRKETWLARKGELLLSQGEPERAREAYEASLAAVRTLPMRLQQSPGMIALQEQVNTVLAGITDSPGKLAKPKN